ncbi:hypothetical protein ACF9IK_31985 [Kitasatospora hibisci]|uniref:hypothetical protein n=1 Tax=Kitasatospora hibisci TaxID=3369522 RepID=UPI00375482C3
MHHGIGKFLAASASLAVVAVGGTITPAAADDSSHDNRVLVVVANFKDRKHPDANAMRDNAIAKYFGADGSLSSYYGQVSRGRFTFVPAVKEKVVGPLTLNENAGCGDLWKVRQDVEAQMAAKGLVRKRDWDNLSIVLPHLGCYWLGMGSIGGRFTWLNTGDNDVNEGTIRHEFGHNIGFGHQIRYLCNDGNLVDCGERAAVAGRSPMGGNGQAGLSATQLIRLGWLSAAEHQRATGSGTFTLRPLYGARQGTRALEIPMGKDSLVLEYRRPSGSLDTNLNGVYAYRVTGGAYHTASPIVVSTADHNGAVTELHDKAGKVTVKVTGQNTDGATVAVSLGGAAAPAGTAPSVPVTPAVTADASTGPATTPQDVADNADPADPDGPADVEGTDTGTDTGTGTGGAPGTAQPTAGGTPGSRSTAPGATGRPASAGPATAGAAGNGGGTGSPAPNLAETGGDGTAITLTALAGTGLVLGGVFLASRRARSRHRADQRP